MPPALTQVRGGKLRALAVTTPKRVAVTPDVPTISEAGAPDTEVTMYSGVLGPANMPPAVVDRLNKAFNQAIQSEKLTRLFADMGATAEPMTPEAMGQVLKDSMPKFAAIVKELGIHID